MKTKVKRGCDYWMGKRSCKLSGTYGWIDAPNPNRRDARYCHIHKHPIVDEKIA